METRIQRIIRVLAFNYVLNIYFVSVWYDVMPTGQWWDYAVKHIPNLVMVYRETPQKIFNTTIKIPEHKCDITRLEAILALGLYTLFS